MTDACLYVCPSVRPPTSPSDWLVKMRVLPCCVDNIMLSKIDDFRTNILTFLYFAYLFFVFCLLIANVFHIKILPTGALILFMTTHDFGILSL